MSDTPHETWSDSITNETAATVAERPDPAPGGGPTLMPATGHTTDAGVSRRTVLPRLEVEGEAPKLVQEERPRFESLRELGEGGLGVVVAARDLDIGRRVAIKRIRPDRQSQAAFLRFVQEVRTVGRLDHPNIVPIHDVGKDDEGGYYFVMKYVEGQTLEDVIERLKAGDREAHARWTFERRMELFQQILHAVAFAHARGIVHRDLKPANVMIGAHGEVQLLDWGVAKQLDQVDHIGPEKGDDPDRSLSVTHTRAGSLIGTPRYMSPEQARGEPVDARADTWALSMICYELLTLQHPLDDLHTLDEVLDGVQNREIRPPHERPHRTQPPVPADLSWYAYDGLKRDPSARYQTVQQMLTRLERRNEGDYPIQCPITFQKQVLRRTERFVDRHPVAAMGLVLGTGLATVGSVVVAGGTIVLGAAGALVLL